MLAGSASCAGAGGAGEGTGALVVGGGSRDAAAGGQGIRLRPLSIGDVLDETFLIYKRQFVAFITVMGVVEVPAAALSLVMVVLSSLLAASPGSETSVVLGLAVALLSLPISLLTIVGQLLAGVATVLLASDVVLGRPLDIWAAYRHAFRRFLSVLLASFLGGLAAMAACICFPIAIFLGLRWALVFPAVVLEGHGGIEALRRSWNLMGGQEWRMLACSILIGLLVSILIVIPASLFVLAIGGWVALRSFSVGDSLVLQIGQVVFQSLGETLFGALGYIMMTRFYYDVRVRAEALDLELRIPRAQPVPAPPLP